MSAAVTIAHKSAQFNVILTPMLYRGGTDEEKPMAAMTAPHNTHVKEDERWQTSRWMSAFAREPMAVGKDGRPEGRADEDWEKARALVEMSIEPRRTGKDAAAVFRRALSGEWLELRAATYT